MTSTVSVGSPMWDTMVCVDESFLAARALPCGDATLVADAAAFAKLREDAVAASSRPAIHGCGGCSCNTVKVLACLGIDSLFCGGIGSDTAAQSFRAGLSARGIQDFTVVPKDSGRDGLNGCATETGQVLCLVTPGGERTFAYRPGASATLTSVGLLPVLHKQAATVGGLSLVYFDVYTLLCPGNLPEDGMREARRLGAKVGLNLGSPGIVAAQRERLMKIMQDGLCDAVFMNQDEAVALYGCGSEPGSKPATCPEEACTAAAEHCELTVVTTGVQGLWVSSGRAAPPHHTSVHPVDVTDSTGAGDFFAGGFLSAWLRGAPTEVCVQHGAAAAAAVLVVFGTDLGDSGWSDLKAACLGDA